MTGAARAGAAAFGRLLGIAPVINVFDRSVGAHVGDDVVVHMLEIAELLVEMARQQQRGVVELALGDLERPFAELQGEVAGAEHDRDHEPGAAQDQPLDRAELQPRQRAGDRTPPPPNDHAVRSTRRHFSPPPQGLVVRGHKPKGR